MKKPKILVVGSIAMDQIATTSVFPAEGQTVLGNSFCKAAGGKGANQAAQLARLGAEATLCGKLGFDANAEELLAVCKKTGIDTSRIVRDKSAPSGCTFIILEERSGEPTKNRILVLPGTNMKIEKSDVAFLENGIKEYDMVMLQHEIPMEINELVAKWAQKNGVPVMLNPAPSASLSDEFLSHLDFISPNEHETADLTGVSIKHSNGKANMESAKKAAEVFLKKGVKNVLITLGEDGAAFFNKNEVIFSPAMRDVAAVDPTAAGDSFVAAFCTSLCCGATAKDSLLFANCAAALTVSKMGAMPSLPTLAEVLDFAKRRKISIAEFA